MAMSQEAPSPYICHFKIQSSVLPNQDSYQYHFDKLYVNAALPGGNGTPDILLSNLGSEFCYNGTQIIEDRSAFNQKIDFTTGLMFLEVPDDKSADWNRLIANGYATSTGKTEVDANGWSIGNDGSITYSSDKPRPWSRWSGWMTCYWWHLQPQLFYYTDGITSLDQLPSNCAAVSLHLVNGVQM